MKHYAGSGLSQKAFCQREGLAMSTFSKWRKQLGLVHTKPEIETTADFKPLFPILRATDTVQLAENDHGVPDWDVELALGSGMTLRIRVTE